MDHFKSTSLLYLTTPSGSIILVVLDNVEVKHSEFCLSITLNIFILKILRQNVYISLTKYFDKMTYLLLLYILIITIIVKAIF